MLAFGRLASPFFKSTFPGAFARLRFEVMRHTTQVAIALLLKTSFWTTTHGSPLRWVTNPLRVQNRASTLVLAGFRSPAFLHCRADLGFDSTQQAFFGRVQTVGINFV